MGDYSTRVTAGTYQYFDGANTTFAGAEARYGENNWFVSAGGYIASDDLKNPYGLFDLKGKLNYDSKGTFEQNIRIRSAFDGDLKSTQIRYSPCTVNIPVNNNVSVYSNTHYSGKYNYESRKWTHSAGNFTGVSYNPSKSVNISLEAQRYNLQDIKDNNGGNWGVNAVVTYKF